MSAGSTHAQGKHRVAPSAIHSPYTTAFARPLTTREVGALIDCFAAAIAGIKAEGFDGVQLHAAHGGLLSQFLSPYANRRTDAYGGSAENRARIVREIVARAREQVGDFPILVKMNSTDYMPGGVDADNLPELAGEIAAAGVDAIELSGGMWDCLVRPEAELGFRPVPAAESQTQLPNIVDFVALCRPLICEPDLPRRWLAGKGGSSAMCISCNSCLYDMYTRLGRGEPGLVRCLYRHDRSQVGAAQRWLHTWVKQNALA